MLDEKKQFPEEATAAQPQTSYSDQVNDIWKQIQNRDKFSFELDGNALYEKYKNQYTLNGQRAMKDTMAQGAALTGGYGNSYGQMVGQQAYNQYMEGLNDVALQLQQQERAIYDADTQNLYSKLGAAQTMQDAAYKKLSTFMGVGYMPTDEELAAAGLTREQAQALYDAMNQKSSGGGGRGTKAPVMCDEETFQRLGETWLKYGYRGIERELDTAYALGLYDSAAVYRAIKDVYGVENDYRNSGDNKFGATSG